MYVHKLVAKNITTSINFTSLHVTYVINEVFQGIWNSSQASFPSVFIMNDLTVIDFYF